jgi:hypothetical protein
VLQAPTEGRVYPVIYICIYIAAVINMDGGINMARTVDKDTGCYVDNIMGADSRDMGMEGVVYVAGIIFTAKSDFVGSTISMQGGVLIARIFA